MLLNILRETLVQLCIQNRKEYVDKAVRGLRHIMSRRFASSLERKHLLKVRQRKLRAFLAQGHEAGEALWDVGK